MLALACSFFREEPRFRGTQGVVFEILVTSCLPLRGQTELSIRFKQNMADAKYEENSMIMCDLEAVSLVLM